jgi:hypothetical protein
MYAPPPVRGNFCFLYCVPTKHHNIVGVRNANLFHVSLLPRMTLFFVCYSLSFVSQLMARVEPYVPCR